MAQVNGSHFKFVYTNWLETTGSSVPLANGIHPVGIKKYYEFFNNTIPIDFIHLDNLEAVIFKKYPHYEIFFMLGHSLLATYLYEFFPKICFIKESEIKNDNSFYFYPVETNRGNYALYHDYTVNVDGKDIQCSFIDNLPENLIQLFKTNKLRLLISGIQDPCHSDVQLESFMSKLEKRGIPVTNPIFISGNKQLNSKYNTVSGILSLYEGAKLFKRYPTKTQMGYVSDLVKENDLNHTIRGKRFLCFNRHFGRKHRIYLAYLYLKYKLYENGYFSFLCIDNIQNIDNNFESIRPILENIDKLSFQRYIDELKSKIPIQLDTHHLKLEELRGFSTVDNYKKDFYINTYVHIVSETCMNNLNFTPFFSEKTVRPLMNLQPFVYFGDYHALKTLKDLGFKTFSPFIDESYDEEPDPLKRMKLAGDQVIQLNNMPINKLHEWYYSITDILIHNQKHLQTFSHYEVFKQAITDAGIIYKNEFTK